MCVLCLSGWMMHLMSEPGWRGGERLLCSVLGKGGAVKYRDACAPASLRTELCCLLLGGMRARACLRGGVLWRVWRRRRWLDQAHPS